MAIKIFFGVMIGIVFYAMNNLFAYLGVLNTWSLWRQALRYGRDARRGGLRSLLGGKALRLWQQQRSAKRAALSGRPF